MNMIRIIALLLISVTTASAQDCKVLDSSLLAPVSETTPGYTMVEIMIPIAISNEQKPLKVGGKGSFRFFLSGVHELVAYDTYTGIKTIERCVREVRGANGERFTDSYLSMQVVGNVSNVGANAFLVKASIVMPAVTVVSKPEVFTRLKDGEQYSGAWATREGRQYLVLSSKKMPADSK